MVRNRTVRGSIDKSVATGVTNHGFMGDGFACLESVVGKETSGVERRAVFKRDRTGIKSLSRVEHNESGRSGVSRFL